MNWSHQEVRMNSMKLSYFLLIAEEVELRVKAGAESSVYRYWNRYIDSAGLT